jgi:hypothetical protein
MCRKLMDENGLQEWGIDVSHARRQAASMHYPAIKVRRVKKWTGKPGRIILSGPLMSLWTREQQRDTILHEIAHCLCPDDGHGAMWGYWCGKLGILPKPCWGSDGEAVPPPKPPRPYVYVGSCPGGHNHRRENRPSRKIACTACNPVPQERYIITWRKELQQ